MRINLQEVLNAVAVVSRSESHLLEDGADPYRCYTETAQISQFALQSLQCPALPTTSSAEPSFVGHRTDITAGSERACAGLYGFVISISSITTSAPSSEK